MLRRPSGRILLDGDDITMLQPEARVKRGLARTFQINQLFPTMTPLDALTTDRRRTPRHRRPALVAARRRRARSSREAEAVAGTFRLGDVLDVRTSQLPYGKQRLLEIALAVAARPRVLLLDEPAAGVPEADRRIFSRPSRRCRPTSRWC